jgi:putative sterol carrier protein
VELQWKNRKPKLQRFASSFFHFHSTEDSEREEIFSDINQKAERKKGKKRRRKKTFSICFDIKEGKSTANIISRHHELRETKKELISRYQRKRRKKFHHQRAREKLIKICIETQ